MLAALLDAGTVRFSDLVVAESGASADNLRAAVVYVCAERATALFDIYGLVDWKPEEGSVKVEITREGSGSPAVTIPVTVKAVGPSNWRVTADLPIRDLSPGTYIATAHVTLPGIPRQRLDRAFLR